MSDSIPATSRTPTGLRPMLLGIGAILTGGILTIRQLILHQTDLPTQSPLMVALVQAGFAVTVLGFLYGTIADKRTTSPNDD